MPKVLTKDLLLRQTRQSTDNEEDGVRLLGPEEEKDTPGKKTLLTPPPSHQHRRAPEAENRSDTERPYRDYSFPSVILATRTFIL